MKKILRDSIGYHTKYITMVAIKSRKLLAILLLHAQNGAQPGATWLHDWMCAHITLAITLTATGSVWVCAPRKIPPQRTYFLGPSFWPFGPVWGCLPDMPVWTGIQQVNLDCPWTRSNGLSDCSPCYFMYIMYTPSRHCKMFNSCLPKDRYWNGHREHSISLKL